LKDDEKSEDSWEAEGFLGNERRMGMGSGI